MLRRIPTLKGLNLRDSEINRPPDFAQDCRNVEKNSKGEVVLRWGYEKILDDNSIIDLFEYVGAQNDPNRGSLFALKADGIYRLEGNQLVKVPQGNENGQPVWTSQTKTVEYNKVLYWNDPDLNIDLWKFDAYSQYRAGVPKPQILTSDASVLNIPSYYFRVFIAYYDPQGSVTYSDYITIENDVDNIDITLSSITKMYYDGFYSKYAEFDTNQPTEIEIFSTMLTADLGANGSHNYLAGDYALLLESTQGGNIFTPVLIESVTATTITFDAASVGTSRFRVNSAIFGGIERRYEIFVYRSESEFSGYKRLKETTFAVNEIQRVTFGNIPVDGTYRLIFDNISTTDIDVSESLSSIESKLDVLGNIDDVTVTDSGFGTYDIEFGGSQAGANVTQILAEITDPLLTLQSNEGFPLFEFNLNIPYTFQNLFWTGNQFLLQQHPTVQTGIVFNTLFGGGITNVLGINGQGRITVTANSNGDADIYFLTRGLNIPPNTPIFVSGRYDGPTAPFNNADVRVYRANGSYGPSSPQTMNPTSDGTFAYNYQNTVTSTETVVAIETRISFNVAPSSTVVIDVDFIRQGLTESTTIATSTVQEGGANPKKNFFFNNTEADTTLEFNGVTVETDDFTLNLSEIYDDSLVRILPPKAKYMTLYNEYMILGNIDPKNDSFGFASIFGNDTRLEDAIVWSDIATLSNGASIETFLVNNVRSIGDSGDGAVVGLFGNDDNLVVHKEKQSYYVNGDFISNTLRIRRAMTEQIGSASHRSIVNVEGGHLYASPKGIFLAVGGARPIELSDLIEPLFTDKVIVDDLELDKAKSVTDFLREKIYIFIPQTNDKGLVLSYDYYHKDWFIHDNIPAKKGFQDVGISNTDIYFADENSLYVRKLDKNRDDGRRIDAYYWTGWFDLEIPSIVKKFVNFILLSIAKKDFTATIKGYCNWQTDNEEASNTVTMSKDVNAEDSQVLQVQANSVSYRISNESDGSDFHITSYEVEYEQTQTKPKGTT